MCYHLLSELVSINWWSRKETHISNVERRSTWREQLMSLTTRSNCWWSNVARLFLMWLLSSSTSPSRVALFFSAFNTAGNICQHTQYCHATSSFTAYLHANLYNTPFSCVLFDCLLNSQSVFTVIASNFMGQPEVFNITCSHDMHLRTVQDCQSKGRETDPKKAVKTVYVSVSMLLPSAKKPNKHVIFAKHQIIIE